MIFFFFEIIKISWKYKFFFVDSNYDDEKLNQFKIIVNKLFIKIDKIQKSLNVFDVLKWFSIDNDLNFFWIHFDVVNNNDELEIFDFVDVKFAFVNVQIKICNM